MVAAVLLLVVMTTSIMLGELPVVAMVVAAAAAAAVAAGQPRTVLSRGCNCRRGCMPTNRSRRRRRQTVPTWMSSTVIRSWGTRQSAATSALNRASKPVRSALMSSIEADSVSTAVAAPSSGELSPSRLSPDIEPEPESEPDIEPDIEPDTEPDVGVKAHGDLAGGALPAQLDPARPQLLPK